MDEFLDLMKLQIEIFQKDHLADQQLLYCQNQKADALLFKHLLEFANVCFDSQAPGLETYRALLNALQNVLFET